MSNAIVTSKDVLSRQVRGETVLLDLKTENYFGLTGVGARVWQLLSEGKTRAEIRATLASEYGVSEDRVDSDLDRFVGDLESAGLVTDAKS